MFNFLKFNLSNLIECIINFFPVINPCLEPATVNGSTVLRDTGVCGAHGTCKFLFPGNYTCNCHKDYVGNHCHKSKFTVIFVAFFLSWLFFSF